MQYMMPIYLDENSITRATAGPVLCRLGRLCQAIACRREVPRRGAPPSDSHRHPHSSPRGQTGHHERPVCRESRTTPGILLINGANLDEALDIGAKIPAGRWGIIEVRPVMEIAGLPSQN